MSALVLDQLVLALRGVAAIVVLTTLVGGIPRVAQAALAITLGLWSAVMVASGDIATGAAGAGTPFDATWAVAIHELAIGAALGVLGAIPLVAAAAAGRLVDLAATGRAQGPYAMLFGLLAAAVFVGIDGHVTVITAIVDSHTSVPSVAAAKPSVLAAIGHLIPAAIRLAIPWLVTAAVVQIAVGVGMRLANRASAHAPEVAAVPAALVMMTASLVATLAISMAAIMRGTL